jgi:dTDP-4-dehydrorhamnose reductase
MTTSNKNKILILGKTGMLGSMVYTYLKQNSNSDVQATDREKFDVISFLNKNKRYHFLHNYDYIINCVGIIKPYCKDDNAQGVYDAIKVNTLFPLELQRFCKNSQTKIIQIATDCVYSGKKGNYVEDDKHDALDVYGKTKSLGEVVASNFLNIRCSIIGPEIKNKLSLLEWFLNQPSGSTLQGYSKHFWNGVTTLQFAKLCKVLLMNNNFEKLIKVNSVHHFIPNQNLSKYELLQLFKKYFNKDYRIKKATTETINRTLSTKYKLLGKIFPETSMEEAIKELADYMKSYRLSTDNSSLI